MASPGAAPAAEPATEPATGSAAEVAVVDAAAPEGSTTPNDAPGHDPVPAGGARAEPPWAETAAALAGRFPALFTPGAPRPIKLRIQVDIQQRAPGVFTRKQLSVFLHRHTTGTAYLRALAASAQRFDLDGNASGEVSAEHREAAVAELERRRQIVLERRAAERKARPPPRSAPATASGAAPAPGADRPPRRTGPDGPPLPDRPPRSGGGPRPGGAPPRDRRGDRHAPDRPASRPGAADPALEPRRDAPVPRPEAAPLPEDPARRERALLLRAWESSPLTPANFCALKGLNRADFEARIDLARRERGERRG